MTNRIIRTYRNWRKYRQTYGALARLTARDLEDLGIDPAEISAAARRTAAF